MDGGESKKADHCEGYKHLPEGRQEQIDKIVAEVMTRVKELSEHMLIKRVVMPVMKKVLGGFLQRVQLEHFSENEVSTLLMEIWRKINEEFKVKEFKVEEHK